MALAALVLVSLLADAALGQKAASTEVSQLKSELAHLKKIEDDPETPPEVRDINRTFLEERRGRLRGALEKRITALRTYLTSSAGALKPNEVEAVETSIRALEEELRGLDGRMAGHVAAASVQSVEAPTLARRASPVAGEVSAPGLNGNLLGLQDCPANPSELIESAFINKDQRRLEIKLVTRLSRTQPPGVVSDLNELIIPANRIVIATAAGAPIASSTAQTLDGRRQIFVNLPGDIPEDVAKIRVTLLNLGFQCPDANNPTTMPTVSKDGDIFSLQELRDRDVAAYRAANAAAKTSDKKNYRLGFVASKGNGEEAEGAADISINKDLGLSENGLLSVFDEADLALQLKKSSAEKADPRHLTLGLSLRKTFLVDSRLPKVEPLTEAMSPPDLLAASDRNSEAIKASRNKGFFRVFMITESLNLEGEAFDFKTVNFVSDTQFELASIAKRLGPKGYYNLSIFGGPEIGRNLSIPEATSSMGATAAQMNQVDWISRLKAGGHFTLRFLPGDNTGSNWGVELDLGFVNRYLFSSELTTEETTDNGMTKTKLVSVSKGNKTWRQADLKLFLFGNEKARYGVKLSYNNGRLPPAFTPTKAFQFGLVVESADDRTDDKPANADDQ
ncbi:MAG TPA: hypothetical protein VEY09_10970 [Pyrinomonadaceae bacterium]|nr:hypothetical protein [Pyrinomonadaceae bacterium]